MEQPKTRAELTQALADLASRGAVDLVVDPATRMAAVSQRLDPYEGPVGTGPHALHRRSESNEKPSSDPSFDERVEAHRAACAAAVLQFEDASTEEEIQAAGIRLSELAKSGREL